MSQSALSSPSLSVDLLQGQMKNLSCRRCSPMEIFHFSCQKKRLQDIWIAKVNRLPVYDCRYLQARASALKHTAALIQARRASHRLLQGMALFSLSVFVFSLGGGIYSSLNDRKAISQRF